MTDNELTDELAQAILEAAESEHKKPILTGRWSIGFFVFIVLCVVLGIYSFADINEDVISSTPNHNTVPNKTNGVETADKEKLIGTVNPGEQIRQDKQRVEYHIGVGCQMMKVTHSNIERAVK